MNARVVFVMTGVVAAGGAGGAFGQKPGDAVAAARDRQDAVRGVEIEFERIEVAAKGAVSGLYPNPLSKGLVIPARETTSKSANRLVIDGDRIRYEDRHPMWSATRGGPSPTDAVSVFDGSMAKAYHPNGFGRQTTPSGVIGRSAQHMDARLFLLIPATMTFRGLDPNVAPHMVSELKPTGAVVPIDGSPCHEYIAAGGGQTSTTCWLDAGKEYVVKRVRRQRGGRLVDQLDVSYGRNAVCRWHPVHWVRHQFSPAGAVLLTDTVSVKSIEFNSPQADERFAVRFPDGATVHDQRTGKDYRVQPGGELREVVASSGQEVGPPIPQPGTPWVQRNLWLLVAVIAALVVALYAWAVRRRAAPRPSG